MAVKIRLMRIGAKGRPFYRVVAVDEHKKRTGAYLELLGTYNPLTKPKEINLKQERVDAWVKQGAILSDGFLRIIHQAPQKPPRKPRKTQADVAKPLEKSVSEPVSVSAPEVGETEATPAETQLVEEVVSDEVKTESKEAE